MRQLSLSQRLKLAYILSFLLISSISLILIFAVSKQIEDYIFEKQLASEIEQFTLASMKSRTRHLPDNITLYNSKSELPNNLGQYIDEQTLGVFELDHPGEDDFHYGITHLNGQNLIFLFDVSGVELSEDVERKVSQSIVIGFLVLLTVLYLSFQLILKRALKPMYLLIQQVKMRQENPDSSIKHIVPEDNELGLLNKTIVEYSECIEAFIQREREFTSFVSHELRTPVTVIKGALSLLQLNSDLVAKGKKPIDRIGRATQSMEDMIEMLLSLSREHNKIASVKTSLAELVPMVIANLQDKAISKSMVIEIVGELSIEQSLEKIPAELVLTNLLRNALQHGYGEIIHLTTTNDTITIANDVLSVEEADTRPSSNENNYGLGSLIVERICKNQNWHFHQHSAEGKYIANVDFRAQAAGMAND